LSIKKIKSPLKLSKEPEHPNEFEHLESFFSFIGYFLLYGTIGSLIGRSIDKLISVLESDSKIIKTSLFFLQLLINAVVFYVAFKTITLQVGSNKLSLDSWMGATFQGLIFVTNVFSAQSYLYENIKNGLF
jgi:hypothetical protein